MQPLKLNPHFTDYLWGGRKLVTDFNKKCDYDKVAESWELSCHKDGHSVIVNGEYAGKTLQEYIDAEGKTVLGTNCEKFDNFPILIKLIDARDNLSVQVHPKNEYALRVEGEYGKTEMWYIVDCEEGAQLLYGFKNPVSKEEFKERIENNTLLEITNAVPVKPGDCFFIEAGTLHAIGKGILIAEIQQNSNTTYRIYDYGRVGADGKPRQLHIDKALDVTELKLPTPPAVAPSEEKDGHTLTPLAKCEYFDVKKVNIKDKAEFVADEKSFHAVMILSNDAVIEYDGGKLEMTKGDTAFIPANMGKYSIVGECDAILTTI